MNANAAVPTSESSLRGFHDAAPGGSPLAFAHHRVLDDKGCEYADTYAALLDAAAHAGGQCPLILDLACGDGHSLSRLTGPHRCVGIDLSRGELLRARQTWGTRVALIQARAQQLPLPDASIDTVMSHMALMLMDEPQVVLGEIRRVLKPSGRLVAVVGAEPPDRSRPEAAVTHALRARWQQLLKDTARRRWTDVHFAHARAWRSHELLHELLAPHFEFIHATHLHGFIGETPEQIWEWFGGTYDAAMIPNEQRDWAKRGLMETADALQAQGVQLKVRTDYWLLEASRA